MAGDKRVDDDIEQFLQWHSQQAKDGYTIANLMLQQEQFRSEVRRFMGGITGQVNHLNERMSQAETNHDDLRGIVDEHTVALSAIKRRVRNGPQDTEMDTGVHQIAAIQHRLAEQEAKRRDSERVAAENIVWWKRSIIGWVAGAVGVVVTSLVTVLVTLAIANSRPLPPAPAPAPVMAPR